MFGGKVLDDQGKPTDKEKEKKMGVSLLANYRYYPDVDIDPVKLYVSGGLGGHFSIPFDEKKEVAVENGSEAKTLDKILGIISYKLKVGVDYEIAPQVVGTAALSVGGQLSGLKAKQIPDIMLEVGVRYNF